MLLRGWSCRAVTRSMDSLKYMLLRGWSCRAVTRSMDSLGPQLEPPHRPPPCTRKESIRAARGNCDSDHTSAGGQQRRMHQLVASRGGRASAGGQHGGRGGQLDLGRRMACTHAARNANTCALPRDLQRAVKSRGVKEF